MTWSVVSDCNRSCAAVQRDSKVTVECVAAFVNASVHDFAVISIPSIASFQPIPTLATYAATKAYVLSLSESLSEELKGSGVTITALCPGITATNMVSAVQQSSPGLKKIPGFVIGDVDDVAQQGFQACLKGEVICVPGAVNLAAAVAGRAAPKWLLRRVSGIVGRYSNKQ